MRRESHRRRGLYRASSGGFGHRAVYVGAVVAAAALIAGFGAALVVYGPLGLPAHQLSGTTNPIAPSGVAFGNAQQALASQLNLTGADGYVSWNWTNSSGNFTGPCNGTGILGNNSSFFYTNSNNATTAYNISSGGGNTTLVCLNAVENGLLNATWYNATNMHNSYNATNFMPNGSYDNTTLGNISSCNQWNTTSTTGLDAWNLTHVYNYTSGSTMGVCNTYYEQDNNTSWEPSFGAQWWEAGGVLNHSTIWSPNQSGYAPDDVVYELPVVFDNASVNGTYSITVAIQGVTPIAQTFYFNDSIGNTSAAPDTVLFTFDMTSAWLYDTAVELNSSFMPSPTNASAPLVYGIIGITSAIVTECLTNTGGVAYCPTAAPEEL